MKRLASKVDYYLTEYAPYIVMVVVVILLFVALLFFALAKIGQGG